jgi:hypothetical protein
MHFAKHSLRSLSPKTLLHTAGKKAKKRRKHTLTTTTTNYEILMLQVLKGHKAVHIRGVELYHMGQQQRLGEEYNSVEIHSIYITSFYMKVLEDNSNNNERNPQKYVETLFSRSMINNQQIFIISHEETIDWSLKLSSFCGEGVRIKPITCRLVSPTLYQLS